MRGSHNGKGWMAEDSEGPPPLPEEGTDQEDVAAKVLSEGDNQEVVAPAPPDASAGGGASDVNAGEAPPADAAGGGETVVEAAQPDASNEGGGEVHEETPAETAGRDQMVEAAPPDAAAEGGADGDVNVVEGPPADGIADSAAVGGGDKTRADFDLSKGSLQDAGAEGSLSA